MLDEYMNEQPIGYRLLKNATKKNKTSHAYLFESNGYSNTLDIAVAFAKFLICPNNYSNEKECETCSICKRIDDNSFSEIKIINPDGLWIKKEQLENLQFEFSKKAVETNKKVYIINQAEKLNINAANSILKFLEEPEENIIGILITENIYQLLDTIVSRCQIISLNKNKDFYNENIDNTASKIANNLFNNAKSINDYIKNTENIEKIDKIVNFINFYEKNKINTLLYMPTLWHNHFTDKDDIIIAFNIIILYYKDVINLQLGRKVEIFDKYLSQIEEISQMNEVAMICKKLNKILELNEKIRLNVNSNLLMDKFIIELEEV